MPPLLAVRFAETDMPRFYAPGPVETPQPGDWVVASVDGEPTTGVVAGIEWRSTEHLRRRPRPHPALLRRASDADREGYARRREVEKRVVAAARERATALSLPVRISAAAYRESQQLAVIHFTAEERVDFRLLSRDVATLTGLRIELFQLGARDETKMLDGFGVCGLRTCCSAWLPEFRPISVRMARDQEIGLPPAKLTGQCGRFLCCLSYEVDQYREMGREALPKGSTIEYKGKKAVIIDRNLIARTYLLRTEEGPLANVKAEELQGAAYKVPEQMRKQGGRRFSDADGEPTEDEIPPSGAHGDTPRPRRQP